MVTAALERHGHPQTDARPAEFPVSGCIAVVLTTEAEVRAEWTAMRNRALQYAGRCGEGVHRVVSLRDRESGERIATVILKRERGRYVVLDVRRRFDRPADGETWSIAERCALVYGAATASARRAARCRRTKRTEWSFNAGSCAGPQAAFDFGR